MKKRQQRKGKPREEKRERKWKGKYTPVKKRKHQIEKDIKALQEEADEKSYEAEKNNDLTLLSKSNAMRRHVQEKTQQLKCIVREIECKEEEIKQSASK